MLDPPGVAYRAEENRDANDLAFREGEDEGTGEEVGGEEEEETSLLQEVLSSLKTPLPSCSLSIEAECDILKVEQEVEFEIEEGEEMKEEGVELAETDVYQYSPSGFELLSHTTEEEEDTSTVSCQEEVVPEEQLEEEQADEEEEILVELINQHGVCTFMKSLVINCMKTQTA